MQRDGINLPNLYVGLVHYPVYNKRGNIVCTAVTNLDIHDIARCAKTFGVQVGYIINPLDSQKTLVKRIIHHWTEGAGALYNPARKQALERIQVRTTLKEVIEEISEAHHTPVKTVATDARWQRRTVSYRKMHELLCDRPQPYLLVLGTGWGLAREVLEESDYILAPIEGTFTYNHLSVRSAAAVILDRLVGNRQRGGTENGFHRNN
ncbi:MAG: RNA methyltransferase [Proteobacteria bacterium]|nr:RNA methyltransferase [Pseudomonadota bacterium]NIS68232.1 RNA methyltransferase [Pseudomonadota bacterium]